MDRAMSVVRDLLARQDSSSNSNSGNPFLDTITNSTKTTIGGKAAISSLILAVVATTSLTILFCFIRPHNNVVYAPRAKYADSKHAPPPVTKGFFSWLGPLFTTKESELVEKLGLDATVFLRVARMIRNMFTILAVFGCGILIPINVMAAAKAGYLKDESDDAGERATDFFYVMTPNFMYQTPSWLWAYTVAAWIFDVIVYFFLWTNYRTVTRLRRQYFDSPEYRNSLHARTLLITDIPKQMRSDDGILRLVDEVQASREAPKPAIARNVKDLPDLVEEHTNTVKELESVLAKYLKNPDKLPAKRPTCKAHAKDKAYRRGQTVDAIDYLSSRIKELEIQIRQVRESVDKRNALSFGFASYSSIPDAHSVAYAARKSGPRNTVMTLAPRPNDLIWKNLKMMRSERKWQNFINGLWIALLTVAFIVPNVLIAVFLANLNNLGTVWPAFKTSLESHANIWAVVQGILSPAISFLIYLFLPMIFRRLRVSAGDMTKTSRERHVTTALYSFFVLNQFVVVSFFSVAWGYITMLISHQNITEVNLAFKITQQLITLSPYWVSYLLQRNLGVSIDLIQLLRLTYGSIQRRFMSPTPREQIEASAPQPFDYASYYNYYLFYGTVAFVLAPIQPILLAIAAFYFGIDSFVKKYLLLYIFITKYESGGSFWRTIFNRILVFTILGKVIVALVILSVGQYAVHWPKLAALAPLPLLTLAFKLYCAKAFDDKIHYYQKGEIMRDAEHAGENGKMGGKRDKVSVRFGNPVLYQPLITPMVSAKSQGLLKSIYSGRMDDDFSPTITNTGFSDVYLDSMDTRTPGKGAKGGHSPFEFVGENEMDFSHFKNRAEFRDAAGGDGQLFGQGLDVIRPGTPSSTMTGFTRTGTMDSLTHLKHGHHGYHDSNGSFVSNSSSAAAAAAAGRHAREGSNASFFHGHQSNLSNSYNHGRSRSGSYGSDSTKVGGAQHLPDHGTEYPRGYHQTPAMRDQSPAGSDFGHDRGRQASFAQMEISRQASHEGLVHAAAGMGVATPGPGGSYQHTPYNTAPSTVNAGYGPIRYGAPGVTLADSPGHTPDAALGDESSYDYFRRGRGRPGPGEAGR